MKYQFPCPEGHLLEADESAAGQLCTCPTCGSVFAIPLRSSARTAPPPRAAPPVIWPFPSISGQAAPTFSGGASPPETSGSVIIDIATPAPSVLHIPCPNGHELEAPSEMLGQYVMCPHCGAQYRLREEDSVEQRRRQEQEEEARQRRAGKAWLKWSVLITVVVLLGLLVLVFCSAGD